VKSRPLSAKNLRDDFHNKVISRGAKSLRERTMTEQKKREETDPRRRVILFSSF
jgi:hypothetical protein